MPGKTQREYLDYQLADHAAAYDYDYLPYPRIEIMNNRQRRLGIGYKYCVLRRNPVRNRKEFL